MNTPVKILKALISVYSKDNLAPLVHELGGAGVQFVSTGGTRDFINHLGYPVLPVEDTTGYPSIFGGRVKTLHPAVFGGILYRRDLTDDVDQAKAHNIQPIDLVIVDLYPFEDTVAGGGTDSEIIEKIDIGGMSLIRAAAKNYKDVWVISSRKQYAEALELLKSKKCCTDITDRKRFASLAFEVTSHYDTAIFNYFNASEGIPGFKVSVQNAQPLRYGENPHQKAVYYGELERLFEKLGGKELSYNNLVDLDAAVQLLGEFKDETAFVIIKHTNACGVATAPTVKEAYLKALQADPISAFGGILAANKPLTKEAAKEMHPLFFEILIAPDYEPEALALLTSKKNRIILKQKEALAVTRQFKSLLNGIIEQDIDHQTDTEDNLQVVTQRKPTATEVKAMLFAAKVAKHSKSNTIVLATERQMIASGVGQTSRVDALRQAIDKANRFGMDLKQAAMASDAFFPFPDCVEIAHSEGIRAVIQPGGSIKDQDSIAYCDRQNMTMVTTGFRHFKH